MNYHTIKKRDIANGKGIRVSLFCSGCKRHCKDCFNQETWDPQSGKPFNQETVEEIIEASKPDYITGLSLLGGEPMEEYNQKVLTNFVKLYKQQFPNHDIWCWSGYLFEDLVKSKSTLLPLLDVLIDGPFVLEQKDLRLKWRGSKNQRIIDVQKSLEKNKIVLI